MCMAGTMVRVVNTLNHERGKKPKLKWNEKPIHHHICDVVVVVVAVGFRSKFLAPTLSVRNKKQSVFDRLRKKKKKQ